MVCPPPQFQKESKKEARFLANPLSSFPPFAGATLGCYNVTNPQFTLDLLTCRAPSMGYNNVPLGRVYSRVSLLVWLLAVVRLAFTGKIRLTGREMRLCLCWLLFPKLTAVKQAKFGVAKNFYRCAHAKLVCYAMDLMHHWQPCFRTVSAILIVLSTVVAKDAISSFRVQSDPSTDSLSSISLLGWLKTCPEDLAKHAGAFLLMAARWASFFFYLLG